MLEAIKIYGGAKTEEVGQLSREFLDQSNHAIFYASWLKFCLQNLHRVEKTSTKTHKYSNICIK